MRLKQCPFLKRIFYVDGDGDFTSRKNAHGYKEIFRECVGPTCAAFTEIMVSEIYEHDKETNFMPSCMMLKECNDLTVE